MLEIFIKKDNEKSGLSLKLFCIKSSIITRIFKVLFFLR